MTAGGAAFPVISPLINTWEDFFFVKGSLAIAWWMKEVDEKLMQMSFQISF